MALLWLTQAHTAESGIQGHMGDRRRRDPRYKAEGEQDVYVDQVLFGERRGTFVDIGCNDGIHGSNTYFLAQVRGWQGVCVEADPTNFAAIAPNSARTDAKHVALADSVGQLEFRTYNKPGLAGHHSGLASVAKGTGRRGGAAARRRS